MLNLTKVEILGGPLMCDLPGVVVGITVVKGTVVVVMRGVVVVGWVLSSVVVTIPNILYNGYFFLVKFAQN